jgi:hypothetical protein
MEKKNHSQILEQINKDLPKWIINVAKNYDEKYSHFSSNWNLICKKLNTTPKYIIIVKQIPHIKDENANMKIIDYCSKLTELGYIIRRKTELMLSKSGKVIPTKQMYEYMKKSPNLCNIIPESWSDL